MGSTSASAETYSLTEDMKGKGGMPRGFGVRSGASWGVKEGLVVVSGMVCRVMQRGEFWGMLKEVVAVLASCISHLRF